MLIFNEDNLKLDEVFIEIKYETVFKLAKLQYDILDELKGYFTEYALKPDAVLCRDPELGQSISVFMDKMIVKIESDFSKDISFRNFQKIALATIDRIVKLLGTTELTRVGIRSLRNYQTVSVKEASDLILLNYLNFKPTQLKYLKSNELQSQFAISGNTGSFKYNLIVAPQKVVTFKAELEQEKSETNHISFIRADWDFYRDEKTLHQELKAFFNEADKIFFSNVIPFLNGGNNEQ